MKIIGLLALHIVCIYFLRLLWNDKNESIRRGSVFTKLGNISRRKSQGLFYVSVWVDFVALLILYILLLAYSITILS